MQTWPRRIGVGLLATVLAACAASPSDADTERWADALIGALNAQDEAQLANLRSADAVYQDPTFQGALPLRSYWGFSGKQTRDRSVLTAKSVVRQADRVAIEWHATRSRPGGPAISFDGVFLIEVHDQRIVRVRAYYDPSVLLPLLSSP